MGVCFPSIHIAVALGLNRGAPSIGALRLGMITATEPKRNPSKSQNKRCNCKQSDGNGWGRRVEVTLVYGVLRITYVSGGSQILIQGSLTMFCGRAPGTFRRTSGQTIKHAIAFKIAPWNVSQLALEASRTEKANMTTARTPSKMELSDLS